MGRELSLLARLMERATRMLGREEKTFRRVTRRLGRQERLHRRATRQTGEDAQENDHEGKRRKTMQELEELKEKKGHQKLGKDQTGSETTSGTGSETTSRTGTLAGLTSPDRDTGKSGKTETETVCCGLAGW